MLTRDLILKLCVAVTKRHVSLSYEISFVLSHSVVQGQGVFNFIRCYMRICAAYSFCKQGTLQVKRVLKI